MLVCEAIFAVPIRFVRDGGAVDLSEPGADASRNGKGNCNDALALVALSFIAFNWLIQYPLTNSPICHDRAFGRHLNTSTKD